MLKCSIKPMMECNQVHLLKYWTKYNFDVLEYIL